MSTEHLETWSLQGLKVSGKYHGVPYQGLVATSIANGAGIRHTILLNTVLTIGDELITKIHLDTYPDNPKDWEDFRIIG